LTEKSVEVRKMKCIFCGKVRRYKMTEKSMKHWKLISDAVVICISCFAD